MAGESKLELWELERVDVKWVRRQCMHGPLPGDLKPRWENGQKVITTTDAKGTKDLKCDSKWGRQGY